MIYLYPESESEIRQGDIFCNIPSLEINLDRMAVAVGDSLEETSWRQICEQGDGSRVEALVNVRSISAIVITQDCDAVRSPFLSLCEIGEFRDIEGKAKQTTSPKSFAGIITQHARVNQKWFYLPTNERLGFAEKMAVDFRSVTRIRRDNLEELVATHRIGRLNEVAEAHFRERIGEFFRRYPYDEWYPLTRDELEAYNQGLNPPATPFDWQR